MKSKKGKNEEEEIFPKRTGSGTGDDSGSSSDDSSKDSRRYSCFSNSA